MIASALESIEGFRDKWPFAARYARVNGCHAVAWSEKAVIGNSVGCDCR
jgi:hypothetical protein